MVNASTFRQFETFISVSIFLNLNVQNHMIYRSLAHSSSGCIWCIIERS